MKTTTTNGETPADQAGADQSRREVLKRFGRYAAAAPATMVLLDPRSGRADPPYWVPGVPPSVPPPIRGR
jgi:hypothetical protein